MKKLNLPIIKTSLPDPEPLSMEGYQRFLNVYFQCGFDQSYYEKQKKQRMVNVVFKLKPSKYKKT